MKKDLVRSILPFFGAFSVLIWGVNAAAGIANTPSILPSAYAEPLNMILVGVGLIGFGKIMRMKAGKQKGPTTTTQGRLTRSLTVHQAD